jgi:HlyD family secretion protein
MIKRSLIATGVTVIAAVGLLAAWQFGTAQAARPEGKVVSKTIAQPITVSSARHTKIVETVLATGTLVPRNEVLIGPEIEGLRIVQILAEEGDRVERGAVLVRLQRDALDAQLAQSDASLVRADAAIAQAKSQIAQIEANAGWMKVDLDRAKSLLSRGASTQAAVDQKSASSVGAQAQLRAAQDAVNVAQADKVNLQAQRRELQVRISRTEVRSPSAGLVSRRSAKLGAVATAASEPMFRIIENGEVELEAEVPEARIGGLRAGQKASVIMADGSSIDGKVRLAASEVDRNTRLGRVRISLASSENVKIGSFARGQIEVRKTDALTIPASALLYDNGAPYVLTARDGIIHSKPIELGLIDGTRAEVRGGLDVGEDVVARAGAFLRPGDAVVPVQQKAGAL